MVDQTMTGLLERHFPGLALARLKARIRLEHAKRVYDAAKNTDYRSRPTDTRSGDSVMQQAGNKIRMWGRYLDENHDLSIGVLDVLVNNVVGTGITTEPMVMTTGGKPAAKVNDQIRKLHEKWSTRPEVTGELPLGEAQRLSCRSWFRDGEMLTQHVRGSRVRHFSEVPYSFELIEPDLLPFDAVTGRDRVIQGVEKDGWGRPIGYWLYKTHPGNLSIPVVTARSGDLRFARAEDIIHLKLVKRFSQTRGVSVFHGVVRRLDDIKDYEESERIAARIAASMTSFIKKGDNFTGQNPTDDRTFEMQAGMIFDGLAEGEDVGMIKSDRPNQNLDAFIKGQQRGVAAGTSTSYSSISKDYNGTYSAQRQELVEQQPAYGRLQDYFIEVWVRRIYVEFVSAALAAGLLRLGRGVDMETVFDAEMHAPGMPWIDPQKEVTADAMKVENRFKSRTQIIRERGGDPDVVEKQIVQERERDRELGLQQPAPAPAGNGNGNGGDGGDADDDGAGDDDESGAGAGAGSTGGADAAAA
ncbi:MAG: phage portal protein [Rhodospirillales bacterium]|nr:phage portal protein [Rhodospirillales bacterium]MDH3912926.1 phage portal protein [Rhodospirillales bacterium]